MCVARLIMYIARESFIIDKSMWMVNDTLELIIYYTNSIRSCQYFAQKILKGRKDMPDTYISWKIFSSSI